MLTLTMPKSKNTKQILKIFMNDERREEMLDEDEITASENAFMQGREQTPEKRKSQKQKTSHDDSVSVELTKDEYQED